ncbi:MAG TPA: hypothetical protein DCM54_13395 [Gammaproteobacteria bacterium]|nr:hypothetical protein [Gammaproteobacteria bacterium]
MPVIDMSTIKPVGEFGSKAWGEACVEGAIKMLEAANLPDSINWAFSEDYTHPPARLMEGGRTHAGYYLMVKDGKVSGGDSILDEALTIPGFHVTLPWGSICNQSGALYGQEGQRQRSAEEQVLFAAISEYVGRENPFGLPLNKDGNPSFMLEPVGPWPPEVGRALGEGGEEGNGLHNIAATLQTDSPEYADLPVTALRVPIFADMTDQQKADFVKLCGVEM